MSQGGPGRLRGVWEPVKDAEENSAQQERMEDDLTGFACPSKSNPEHLTGPRDKAYQKK
jgi:hypothetical protein